MRCLRCEGLMITIQMEELSSAGQVSGWRCLVCGETTDPGIEANRASHCPPVRSRARVPGSPAGRFLKRPWSMN
jgi:hypothetical protein